MGLGYQRRDLEIVDYKLYPSAYCFKAAHLSHKSDRIAIQCN